MADLTPTVIEPELAAPLGQIIIRWSGLEGWLANLLATLVNADPGALSVLTNSAGSAALIQWILTLLSVHEHKQPELTEVTDLIRRADELRLDRNALVHGIWNSEGCEAGTCLINTFNWKHSEIMKDWLITTADLNDLLSEIDEWIKDYVSLGRKFGFPRRVGQSNSIFDD